MREMNKLSGDCGNQHVRVSIALLPKCVNRQKVLPSYPGRYVRALCEEQDARLGICFVCKNTIGRTPGRKKKKCCTGCKRVAYCSTACQLQDWNEHKPGCKMTLQQIQEEDL